MKNIMDSYDRHSQSIDGFHEDRRTVQRYSDAGIDRSDIINHAINRLESTGSKLMADMKVKKCTEEQRLMCERLIDRSAQILISYR